jgi:hypothetical protein
MIVNSRNLRTTSIARPKKLEILIAMTYPLHFRVVKLVLSSTAPMSTLDIGLIFHFSHSDLQERKMVILKMRSRYRLHRELTATWDADIIQRHCKAVEQDIKAFNVCNRYIASRFQPFLTRRGRLREIGRFMSSRRNMV